MITETYSFWQNQSSFEIYGNIINAYKNKHLGDFVSNKGQLNEEQLKRLLLVSNVVIGAPISEESKDEASTCFEREGIANCSQQHENDEIRAQKQTDGDA
jgi:hypothetical protein